MKTILLWMSTVVAMQVMAQTADYKNIDSFERKLVRQKAAIVRFERVDTTLVDGSRRQLARSYYFDRTAKKLLLISVYENQQRPRKGLQVFYTFLDNRLVKARIVPGRESCRRCRAEYYFLNGVLVHEKESGYSIKDVSSLLEDSKVLALSFLSTAQ